MMANWGVSIRKGISSIRGSVFDLIFPRKCHGCEKAYLGEDEHFWCSSCRTRIEWIRSPLCTLCGKPYPKNPSGSDHYCGECLTSTFHFDRARSAAVHSGIVRDCIHALKFGGRLHHVPSLVQLLHESMEREMEVYEGMILPVPLHTRRLRQRGFNQAALLARELGRRLGRVVRFDVLVRKQWTEPQTRLNREERLENVKNAFQVVSPGVIKGGRILLVDVLDQKEQHRQEESLMARNPFERAQLLPKLGVDLLICGMISQTQQTALASAGIRIIPHICGCMEEVIAALLNGRIENGAQLMPGCSSRKRLRNRMVKLNRKEDC
jgi:predicted amidophosphoribosyltransferase